MRCADGRPFYSDSGIGLTWAPFQRMTDGLCPTTPPVVLPPELDEIERIIREQDAEDVNNAAARPDATAEVTADAPGAVAEDAEVTDENADTTGAALDATAEAIVDAPSAAAHGAD
eukprot:6207363-Pleurochrysis_carterae.AAC.1